MRRFWIILLAAAMALVIALPAATAKKPSPTLFDVTFEFEFESPGFSSTTGCLGIDVKTITMEAGPGGRLFATGDEDTDVPLLDVYLPELEWYRDYPYYPDAKSAQDGGFDPNNDYSTSDIGLTGCHGAGIEVLVSQADDGTKNLISVEDYPRFLMLTIGDGSVDFRWEADYYLESLEAASKNPRKPTVSQNAMEGFSYSDSNLTWAGVWDKTKSSSGLVTGEIYVSHFSPGVYERFPGNPVSVEFTMTITPKD